MERKMKERDHHMAGAKETTVPRVRSVVIGSIGFLTLVDLFAIQAILPQLAERYQISPAEMGLAANGAALGMAVAGPLAAATLRGLARRTAVWASLASLALPTALLAFAPSLAAFAALRILQGVFMASAFTLTLAHFGERCARTDAPRALAAYVTGSVMVNLLGRLIASAVADSYGATSAFLTFSALNAGGALLAFCALTHVAPSVSESHGGGLLRGFAQHLASPALLRAFALGFLILFAFVGLFSYVGFALVSPKLGLSMREAGFVFLCFLPSLVTTPMAGRIAARLGSTTSAAGSLLLALFGALSTLIGDIVTIVSGLAMFAAGTFFAQAVVTSFVGRATTVERATASGLYLSAYYCGGLAGAGVIGWLYERAGWHGAVIGVALALAAATLLALNLKERPTETARLDAATTR
jgi:YNFM family putative membrane transporter